MTSADRATGAGEPQASGLNRLAAVLGVGLLVVLLTAWHAQAAAGAADRLDTAVQEPAFFESGQRTLALDHARAAGTTWVKVDMEWDDVVGDTTVRPQFVDPSNPADPNYDFEGVDELIRDASARGLRPFFSIHDAPQWAEHPAGGPRGTNNPAAADVAAFFGAVARRYSGSFGGLPRVSAFEVWNEVNASFFYMPQYDGAGRAISPDYYRTIVTQVAAAIHAVHPDNLVVAGATFPFFVNRPGVQTVAPLRFMRQFLCMSKRLRPKPNCGPPVPIDVWSHHPYTEGSPTHQTGNLDSISISGLERMGDLLRAAVRHGRISSRGPVQFWVSEWAWDSNGPDPKGVPLALHARWTSEALYRMWHAGVSLASWFFLRDGGGGDSNFQSGLYFRCEAGVYCDKPKPALQAFRFPFVAFRGRRVLVWGRTPGGTRAKVVVERSRKGRWLRVSTLKTNGHGIFTKRLRAPRHGRYRARLAGRSEASLGFSLKRPADFRVSPPVG